MTGIAQLAARSLNSALGKLGFQIKRTRRGGPPVNPNFINLANAYEHHLSRAGARFEPNGLRVELMSRLLGTPPAEAYFIVDALAACKAIAGDVCEFGVAQGETSALIANEISAGNKALHLYDSFEGLPKPTREDELKDDIFGLGSMAAYEGLMSCPIDMVQGRLAHLGFPRDRFQIHKGFVESEAALSAILPAQVSFAYIDFDFYEPIRVTLNALHPRLAPGAIVIVDDYDFFSTGVKSAVDAFVQERQGPDGPGYTLTVPDTALGYFAVVQKASAGPDQRY